MAKKFLFILGLLSVALTSSRCSNDDDDFRYSPANSINKSFEITFGTDGETVDGSFMSRTSGFCNENRDSLKIWEKDNRHLIVRFPSPNEYSKTTTEKTKEGTVTRASYTSTMTIGGKKCEVRSYFTLTVPYEYENQYRDFEFRMTEIEIGGVRVEVTPYDAASGYVDLVKSDDGSWKAKK